MTNNHTEPMKVGDECRIEFEDWARAQSNYSLFEECWRGWQGAMSVVYAKISARLGCHPAMLMQEIDQLTERADSRPTADEYRQLQIAHDNVCMMYQRAAAKEVVQSHGADFELFAKCNGYDVSKNQYGNYTDADTINARDAFNAGRRTEPSPADVGSDGLPALPKAVGRVMVVEGDESCGDLRVKLPENTRLFSAQQMQDYARQALSQQPPATVEGEALRTTWLSDGYTCINCGKGLSAHEDQIWCPALSSHPVSDDQQAKDAARYRFLRAQEGRCNSCFSVSMNIGHDWITVYGDELDGAIDGAAKEYIDAALSTTKQEERKEQSR